VPASFREEDFFNFSPSETRIAHGNHVFLSNRDEVEQYYRAPYIDASCKMLLCLAKWFQRFLGLDQPEIKIVYVGHVC
jgi:hypothetical protein